MPIPFVDLSVPTNILAIGQTVWVRVETTGHHPAVQIEPRSVVSQDAHLVCLLLRTALCDRLEFWPRGQVFLTANAAAAYDGDR